MTAILLSISLLLHVVAFYFIAVLYMKYSTIKELSDTQKKMIEETEQAMTSFLIEMKDENERLLQHLNSSSEHPQQRNKSVMLEKKDLQQNEIPSKESRRNDLIVERQEDLPDYLAAANLVEDIIEITNAPQEKMIPFELEAINLFKNGHTVEQIAKKLNKGKIEIELLLKFRQK
ncbi:hypothetical protein [Metabacillus rhizolycopersici]|uniref:Swarming motility protein SwrB n=1 Tax=Metabacillus rhizolycopersici TaxID=2875709 RepID=A0ABS7UPC2_9BACI|nr:hypothetical protein [Metabacillus rhizolycopersici]MBZ5749897.1 hypothetical protein [Metabacillus rhizolycopersici]